MKKKTRKIKIYCMSAMLRERVYEQGQKRMKEDVKDNERDKHKEHNHYHVVLLDLFSSPVLSFVLSEFSFHRIHFSTRLVE